MTATSSCGSKVPRPVRVSPNTETTTTLPLFQKNHHKRSVPHHQQHQKQPAQNQSPMTIDNNNNNSNNNIVIISRPTVYKEISRQVICRKLARQRHCVIEQAISPDYLDTLFPTLLSLFRPQTVHYNGGIAGTTEWKISCYLEVMPGGIPTTEPSIELLHVFTPLLDQCNELFAYWYRQQHAKGRPQHTDAPQGSCRRLMTFITRYTPNPGEQALFKHIDGAGKVDGSLVVALPMDRWSSTSSSDPDNNNNGFVGGGLTFWDGTKDENGQLPEIHYDTRSGDVAMIDRAVWHQADPITKGTRWALVIFYKVE